MSTKDIVKFDVEWISLESVQVTTTTTDLRLLTPWPLNTRRIFYVLTALCVLGVVNKVITTMVIRPLDEPT